MVVTKQLVGETPNAHSENGPFCAVKVHPGSFGTFAGIAANGQGKSSTSKVRQSQACTQQAMTEIPSWAVSTLPVASILALRWGSATSSAANLQALMTMKSPDKNLRSRIPPEFESEESLALP